MPGDSMSPRAELRDVLATTGLPQIGYKAL